MADVKQFIFFDFEMLCSNTGMVFQEMEAIRLGAVKYNLETEEISSFDAFIKPQNNEPLSNFCKRLTGITEHNLSGAKSFKKVFEEFLTWVGGVKKSRFFSWSSSDLSRLKLDADRHNISNVTISKIESRYTDFQAIFTKRVSKSNQSVENALQLYDLNFIGEAHNPMFDAYNTLRIYLKFLKEPLLSDLIMINQFILEEIPDTIDQLNVCLNEKMKDDFKTFIQPLHDIYLMKDAKKILKKAERLAGKYENVLMNRSGIFSRQNVFFAKEILSFSQELRFSYEEHFNHAAKIMIFDDHLTQPLQNKELKYAN